MRTDVPTPVRLSRHAPKTAPNALESINRLSDGPLTTLKAEDVHVRYVRLTGDQVNSYHGRFRTEDLSKLAQMTIGTTVLIGHNRSDAGVGRFFDGSVVRYSGHNYTFHGFYWPSARSDADDLAADIDSGIYHSASISVWFSKATCGLCGEDMRDIAKCRHLPGQVYDGKVCTFYYDDIQDVAEGSIVYAGAHPGTGFALSADMATETSLDDGLWQAMHEKSRELSSRRILHHGRDTGRRIPICST